MANLDEFMAKVAQAGAWAHAGGIPRRDCGLAPGCAARAAWLRGWDAAERARKRKLAATKK